MKRGLFAAAALVATAGAADAAILEYSVGFNGSGSVSLPGFDASLGTLTGVSASLSGTAEVPAGSVTGSTAFSPFFPDSPPALAGFIDSDMTAGLGVFSFFYSILGSSFFCQSSSPGGSIDCEYNAYDAPFVATATTLSGLTAFIGPTITGSVSFSTYASVSQGTFTSGPTTSWTGSGDIALTYTYDTTVVPLPAALPLMLGGLGALFALGRRRDRRG